MGEHNHATERLETIISGLGATQNALDTFKKKAVEARVDAYGVISFLDNIIERIDHMTMNLGQLQAQVLAADKAMDTAKRVKRKAETTLAELDQEMETHKRRKL